MLVLDDVLISEEIFTESFICHLDMCKGACCWEGDYGAPLSVEETEILDKIQDKLTGFIPEKTVDLLKETPGYVYEKKAKTWATQCYEDGACIYLQKDETTGFAQCGIEKAYLTGEIRYQKPMSCHLYPIRVTTNKDLGFEAWNYDRWDICSAACTLGAEQKMPVFRFLKNAIIRYKNEDFYNRMEEAYSYYKSQ